MKSKKNDQAVQNCNHGDDPLKRFCSLPVGWYSKKKLRERGFSRDDIQYLVKLAKTTFIVPLITRRKRPLIFFKEGRLYRAAFLELLPVILKGYDYCIPESWFTKDGNKETRRQALQELVSLGVLKKGVIDGKPYYCFIPPVDTEDAMNTSWMLEFCRAYGIPDPPFPARVIISEEGKKSKCIIDSHKTEEMYLWLHSKGNWLLTTEKTNIPEGNDWFEVRLLEHGTVIIPLAIWKHINLGTGSFTFKPVLDKEEKMTVLVLIKHSNKKLVEMANNGKLAKRKTIEASETNKYITTLRRDNRIALPVAVKRKLGISKDASTIYIALCEQPDILYLSLTPQSDHFYTSPFQNLRFYLPSKLIKKLDLNYGMKFGYTIVQPGIVKVEIDRSCIKAKKTIKKLAKKNKSDFWELELKNNITMLESFAKERNSVIKDLSDSIERLTDKKRRILSENIIDHCSTRILEQEQPDLVGLVRYVAVEMNSIVNFLDEMTKDSFLQLFGIEIVDREARVNLRTKTPTGKGVKVTIDRSISNFLRGFVFRAFDDSRPVSSIAGKVAISIISDISSKDIEILYMDNQNNVIAFLDRTKCDGVGKLGVFTEGTVPGASSHKARSLNHVNAVRCLKAVITDSVYISDFFHRTVKKPKQCEWDWYHMDENGMSVWHTPVSAQKRTLGIKGYSLTDHSKINKQLARTFDMEEVYDLFCSIPLVESGGTRWLKDKKGNKLHLIDYSAGESSKTGRNLKSLITGTQRIGIGDILAYFKTFKQSIKNRYPDVIEGVPGYGNIRLIELIKITDKIAEDLIKKQHWVEFSKKALEKLQDRIFGNSNRYFAPEFRQFVLNLGGFSNEPAYFEFAIRSGNSLEMKPRNTLEFVLLLQKHLLQTPAGIKKIRWNLTELVRGDYNLLAKLYEDLGKGVKETYVDKNGVIIRSLGLGTEFGVNQFIRKAALKAREKGWKGASQLLDALANGDVTEKGFYDFISTQGGAESKIVWKFLGDNEKSHLIENHNHAIKQFIGVMLEEMFRSKKKSKGGFMGISILKNGNSLLISSEVIDFSLHDKYDPYKLASLRKRLSSNEYAFFGKKGLLSSEKIKTKLDELSGEALIELYYLLVKYQKCFLISN
ncbi:MAG: hypothetical protein ACFFD4_20055 [Candidatus Odinarchaeota archaeon]